MRTLHDTQLRPSTSALGQTQIEVARLAQRVDAHHAIVVDHQHRIDRLTGIVYGLVAFDLAALATIIVVIWGRV